MKEFHYESRSQKSFFGFLFFQTCFCLYLTKFDPIIISIFAVLWFIFIILKLKISVTENGFSYRLFPFKAQNSNFEEIEWVKFVQIDALGDFWGWGLRYNKKYSWSYVLDGNQAILVQWKNGKKRLFSFENTDELRAIFTEKNLVKNPKVVMF